MNLAQAGAIVRLTALLADLGVTAKVHLFKTGFSPTPNNVKADFTAQEADFTGYTSATLTFSAVGIDVNGVVSSLTNRCFFQATDAVSPNTIGGFWIEDSAGPPTNLIGFGVFPGPVAMTQALSFLALTLDLEDPGFGEFTLEY
jgi:hypothetical protein